MTARSEKTLYEISDDLIETRGGEPRHRTPDLSEASSPTFPSVIALAAALATISVPSNAAETPTADSNRYDRSRCCARS